MKSFVRYAADEPGAMKGAIYANDGGHYILNDFHDIEVILDHYFEDTLILKVFKNDDDIQAGNIPVYEGDTLLMTGLVTKRTYNGKKNDVTFKKEIIISLMAEI